MKVMRLPPFFFCVIAIAGIASPPISSQACDQKCRHIQYIYWKPGPLCFRYWDGTEHFRTCEHCRPAPAAEPGWCKTTSDPGTDSLFVSRRGCAMQ